MAVSLRHTTQATGTDAGNGEIRKNEWNEEHTLTLDSGFVLGRTSAGSGPAEETKVTTNLIEDGAVNATKLAVTISTGNPTGGVDGDLWFKV